MSKEDEERAQQEKLARKVKLSEECRLMLQQRELMGILDRAIDIADEAGDRTIGQEHDRHIGAKKALRDFKKKIQASADFRVTEQEKKAGRPMYE